MKTDLAYGIRLIKVGGRRSRVSIFSRLTQVHTTVLSPLSSSLTGRLQSELTICHIASLSVTSPSPVSVAAVGRSGPVASMPSSRQGTQYEQGRSLASRLSRFRRPEAVRISMLARGPDLQKLLGVEG